VSLVQYCGIDSASPKTIPPFALDAKRQSEFPFLSSHVDKILSGVQGMPIRSKCFDYATDGKRCPRTGSYARVPRIIDEKPIDYNDVPGNVYTPYKLVHYSSSRYPSEKDADTFCGKIESWAPARREWAGSDPAGSEDALAGTGDYKDTPASCTKQVKAKIRGVDECKYKGAYFTVPTTTCDQKMDYGLYLLSCKEACDPPLENLAWSTDCTTENLDGDEAKYCACVRQCNSCVKSNAGCDADDPASDDGWCGECPTSDQSPAPPPPTTPTSAFVCSREDAPADPSAEELPCKSACRGCLAAAMKTSCRCRDRTGSEEYDTSFGECSSGGSFRFSLDKGSSEVYSSWAFAWYDENNPNINSDQALVRVAFQSPGVAWEGHCDGASTTCKVCSDLSTYGSQNTRCMNTGIPQECRGGVWVRSFGYSTPVSLQVPGLPTETAPVVICFLICGIMAFIVVIITSCFWCASMATQAKPAAGAAGAAQMVNPDISSPGPPATLRPNACTACGAARPLNSVVCVACGTQNDGRV